MERLKQQLQAEKIRFAENEPLSATAPLKLAARRMFLPSRRRRNSSAV